MLVFYGSVIQGLMERGTRAETHGQIISLLKECGCTVFCEHTLGRSFEEVSTLLEAAIGPLPPPGAERSRLVRNKMIEAIEDPQLSAAVFEVSHPSTGTGTEIAHAYLRPRMGLPTIPILLLYEQDYWPNGLSSMIKGLPLEELPNIELHEYSKEEGLRKIVQNFLNRISAVA